MASEIRVAVIEGDGIGPEVIREATRAAKAVEAAFDTSLFEMTELPLSADRYLEAGVTVTEDEFRSISEDFDAVLLGALGDPRVPGNEHARDILLGMRFRLDLYVNHRPAILVSPELSPLKRARLPTRIDTFRENTEGAYLGMGGSFKTGTADEIAIEEDVNTRKGVERIVRAAFEFARERGRGRVTLVDKANAQPWAGGLYRRVFGEVAAEFDGIETDHAYIDTAAMNLVRRPELYEVIVTSNLFGDIVSDLAAAVTGGLGMAASANLHPGRHALFEPVHGSAPDIAGRGIANPLGAVRCVGMMLDHFGHAQAAALLEETVVRSVQTGVTTPDLGGSAGTVEVGDWVVDEIAGAGPRTRPSRTGKPRKKAAWM
ncbi:MAG: isocitrate/isopropylmalate dehydrogenase family protein [Gemmatimonadetes bacterium]|nr:isocitrate/isopropylmalate dehydrogenase family protein [Gemmatimonadota bacterium]